MKTINIDGQDYNVFEIITTIRFDDPKDSDAEIKKKFEDWKRFNDSEAGNGGSLNSFSVNLKGKYAEIEDILLNDKKERNEQAKDMISKQGSRIKDLCGILQGFGKRKEVTKLMARRIAKSFRISEANCEKFLKDNGIGVVPPAKKIDLKTIFPLPAVESGIASNIASFNVWAVGNSVPKMEDLYDFVAYIEEKPKSLCLKMSCADLKAASDNCAKKYASDNSDKGHLHRDLASKAATQVFNDQGSRDKYDNLLKKVPLADLFNLLKKIPEELKMEPDFADGVIREIQKVFLDYDVSLALYNKEASLAQNPYEPIENFDSVVCASCHEVNRNDGADVSKRCSACGANLYRKCPSCSKIIPAICDKCPDCGADFEVVKNFNAHMASLETAFIRKDLVEVETYVSLLKPYDSSGRLSKYESFIASEKSKREADGRYSELLDGLSKGLTASLADECVKCYRKYGQVRFDDLLKPYRREIEDSYSKKDLEKLKRLRTQLAAVLSDSDSRKYDSFISDEESRKEVNGKVDDIRKRLDAGVTTSLIEECLKGYEAYHDSRFKNLIMSYKPQSVSSLSARATAAGIELLWNKSIEEKVSYVVMRKEGSAPLSVSDGTRIIKCSCNQHMDSSVKGGREYCYAVFVERDGFDGCLSGSSPCASASTCLDVSDFTASVEEHGIELRFAKPKFCEHVAIFKSEKGMNGAFQQHKEIARTRDPMFFDSNCKDDAEYEYDVVCIYDVDGNECRSSGVGRRVINRKFQVVTPGTVKIDRKMTGVDSAGEFSVAICPPIPEGVGNLYFGVSFSKRWFDASDCSSMKRVGVRDIENTHRFTYGSVDRSIESVYVTLVGDYVENGKTRYYLCDKFKCVVPRNVRCYVKLSESGFFTKKIKAEIRIDYEKSMPDLVLFAYNKSSPSDKRIILVMQGTGDSSEGPASNGTKSFSCSFDAVSINANACMIDFANPESGDEHRLFNVRYDLP